MKTFVTKSFLPPRAEFDELLNGVWERSMLTNNGPLVQELTRKISGFLECPYFSLMTNGTIALQLAMQDFNISEGEIITTPFSYVATITSILWERCTPVFVDIEPAHFCLDASLIEQAITPKTKAIMPVHVFGYACDTEAIEAVAAKHNLKVIYDGAHAFGSVYKGKSLLSYGDAATCSFHATKLFHTVEGGAVILHSKEEFDRIELLKSFGHIADDYRCVGINGKMSELNAAMGLCNFKHFEEIKKMRKKISGLYDRLLHGVLQRLEKQEHLEYNYAYYPVMFKNEKMLLATFDALAKADIFPRRYFFPSLNLLPYLSDKQSCPVSENIASRIACLPLFFDIEEQTIEKICNIILDVNGSV